MSGWIKLDKTLVESLRFKRLAKDLSRSVTRHITQDVVCNETIVLGALTRLWLYADTHIGDDNILEANIDEIDEIVGVQGFAKLMPVDWLKVIDTNHVELPDFLAHNGTSARLRKQGAARQARFRHRKSKALPVRDVTTSNASRNASNDARPDQTKTRPRPDQDQKKRTTVAARPAHESEFAELKAIYPERAGDQEWAKAERAINARLREGHTWTEILDGARRYAEHCRASESIGTQFVKQAASFVGRDKHFLKPWMPPPSKAQRQQDANVEAGLQWLESQENEHAPQ